MKAREFSRTDRVAATIKRALAAPVNELARQNDAGLVTITHVDVAPDMRRATVYLSIYDTLADPQAVLKTFSNNSTELQAVLGRELRTKRTPVISFRRDAGIERADRRTRLLPSGEA